MLQLAGCLGCEIAAGRRHVPGGIVHQTSRWIVNHAVGRLNLGTLIVAPRDHVVAVADLDDDTAAEIGPLLRDVARVVEMIPATTIPAQVRVRCVYRSTRWTR